MGSHGISAEYNFFQITAIMWSEAKKALLQALSQYVTGEGGTLENQSSEICE